VQGEQCTRALGPETDKTKHLNLRLLFSNNMPYYPGLGCNTFYVVKHFKQIKRPHFFKKSFPARGPENFPYLQVKFLAESWRRPLAAILLALKFSELLFILLYFASSKRMFAFLKVFLPHHRMFSRRGPNSGSTVRLKYYEQN